MKLSPRFAPSVLVVVLALALLFLARQAGAADVFLTGTQANVTFKANTTYIGGGFWRNNADGSRTLVGAAVITGVCNVEPGAQNVVVRGVRGDNACVALHDGSHRKNITFEDCEFSGSAGGFWNGNANAFFVAGTSEGVTIRNCVIRDGGYGVIAFNSSGIKLLNNLFINRHQWAHLMNVGTGAVLGGNRG
jgi:parallel beta-helix repeat protein